MPRFLVANLAVLLKILITKLDENTLDRNIKSFKDWVQAPIEKLGNHNSINLIKKNMQNVDQANFLFKQTLSEI